VTLSPSEIIAGVTTSISVGGSVASDGDMLVFLLAGSANCNSAAQSAGRAVLSAGSVTVRIDDVGNHKLCIARQSNPTLDAHFSYVAGVLLVVSHAPPPSPPLPPHDPDAAMTYIVMVIVLAGEVSSFDEVLFKSRLSEELAGVSAADISLAVSSASTRVVITIGVADPSVAAAALSTLTTLAASPASLSAALGMEVLLVEAAPTLRLPPAAPPPSPPLVVSAGASESDSMPIVLAAAVGAVVLLVLAVWCACKRKAPRTKTSNARETPSAKQAKSFTSIVSTSSAATSVVTVDSQAVASSPSKSSVVTADPEAGDVMAALQTYTDDDTPDDLQRTYTVASSGGGDDRQLRVAAIMNKVSTTMKDAYWQYTSADVEWGELLGSGAFGNVHQVSYDGEILAAKSMSGKQGTPLRTEIEKVIKKEYRALVRLTHPNIVQLIGGVLDDPSWVALLMERADSGNLRQMLDRTPVRILNKADVQTSLALDIASGLAYCHSHKPAPILHHDVKSANILLFSDETKSIGLTAKLADFGLAVGSSGMSTVLAQGASTQGGGGGGTFAYFSPEAFSNTYTTASEVYSFAVVLWELLSGRSPWAHKDANGNSLLMPRVFSLVTKEGKRPDVVAPQELKKTDPLAILTRKCWDQKPNNRPAFSAIVQTLESQPALLASRRSSRELAEASEHVATAPYAAPYPGSKEVVADQSNRIAVRFLTLDQEPTLLEQAKALAEIEQAVCEKEAGARERLEAQLKLLRAEQERLRDVRIQSIERSEPSAESASSGQPSRSMKKVQPTNSYSNTKFHAVIQEGQTVRTLYDAAFAQLLNTETSSAMEEYRRAAAAMKTKVLGPDQCLQAIGNMAALYEEAVATRMPARNVMERLSGMTKAKLEPMGPLKRMSRVSEKVLLDPFINPRDPANAQRVCDIVRDMFKAKTMSDVAKVMHLMIRCDEIELLRFKDRFDQPSGGWRDAMINYRLKGSKHVCELQISHNKMAIMREQMGGHKAYGCERNAREILEYVGVVVP